MCSFGSFIITLLLQFSQRYNQILFILRHSSLYLGIAFLVSAIISIFYYIYKSIFIKRNISLISLNIITLVILSISLIWIADTRLDFIAENEVPYYMNEILYDEYNNKIYESVLVGIEPSVEVVEKTANKLVLHIEENCDCQQHSRDIEEFYPDDEFDSFIDSNVEIFFDIEVIYNDDTSIDSYTIEETRNIQYEPNNVQPYYGYVSRKIEISNEYHTDNLIVTQKDFYYADYMDDNEYITFNSNNHYDFSNDEAVTSYYRLKKSLDNEDKVIYIMEHQVQGEDIDEMAILTHEKTDEGNVFIHFEESDNRLNNDGLIIWFGPVKNDLTGSIFINDNDLEYYQTYYQTSVEGGRIGYTEISRIYKDMTDTRILASNTITVDSIEYPQKGLSFYKDLFSTTSYVEMVGRGGTILEDITRLENPLEIDNIKLYEIEQQEYGHSISYYFEASPFVPYNPHENSNLMLLVDLPPNITKTELIQSNYFNYYSMLFQNSYYPQILYENNEMINFIVTE